MSFRVMVLNPGSTSVKLAVYDDEREIFSTNVPEKYAPDTSPSVRCELLGKFIESEMTERGCPMDTVDAFVSRNGKMVMCQAGVYAINEQLLQESNLESPHIHPMLFGPHLVRGFSLRHGGRALVVNQNIDELENVARVTGMAGVWREPTIHSLNQKEVGERTAQKHGKKYEEMNLVIAHLGGGITITAHKHGRMVDSTDAGKGDGPMAPTRSGSILNTTILSMARATDGTQHTLSRRIVERGGLMDHLGTADAREVEHRIGDGDEYAQLIYDGMIYQIAKYIGSMAVALDGNVDEIVLTGGMANSRYITEALRSRIGWIAPISVLAGEYEMESMCRSALSALRGENVIHEYTGNPTFDGTVFMEKRIVSTN